MFFAFSKCLGQVETSAAPKYHRSLGNTLHGYKSISEVGPRVTVLVPNKGVGWGFNQASVQACLPQQSPKTFLYGTGHCQAETGMDSCRKGVNGELQNRILLTLLCFTVSSLGGMIIWL